MDWGGEGETVYLINSADTLQKTLKKAAEYEKTGQAGFILQEYISSNNRTLRVVILGRRVISYWRIQENKEGLFEIISALISADRVHLRPQFHAGEHRRCVFHPKDILLNVSQVL